MRRNRANRNEKIEYAFLFMHNEDHYPIVYELYHIDPRQVKSSRFVYLVGLPSFSPFPVLFFLLHILPVPFLRSLLKLGTSQSQIDSRRANKAYMKLTVANPDLVSVAECVDHNAVDNALVGVWQCLVHVC